MEEIKCPFCECVHEEWWEYIALEKDDQDFEMDCGNCEKLFEVTLRTKRSFYNTKLLKYEIEYEVPPLRAIYNTHIYAAHRSYVVDKFEEKYPDGQIRKVSGGIEQ